MNYILMNKNIEILTFLYDEETHTIVKVLNQMHPTYAPLGITEEKIGISRKAFNNWWTDRAIPVSRSKFKSVLDTLDISSPVELLERCFGLSLSDQYWIKEESSKVRWKDIFNQNPLLDDIRISKIISMVERRIAIVLQRKKERM